VRPAQGHWYIDEPLLYTVNGAKYYIHQNHLFSVSAVTDAAGSTRERYSYTGYGDRAVRTAAGAPLAKSLVNNGIGFTGYVLDVELVQWHARVRQFDATLGRFTARDRLGYPDGFNMYTAFFVPLALDPTGLSRTCVCTNHQACGFAIAVAGSNVDPAELDNFEALRDSLGEDYRLVSDVLTAGGLGAGAAIGRVRDGTNDVANSMAGDAAFELAKGSAEVGNAISGLGEEGQLAGISSMKSSFSSRNVSIWVKVCYDKECWGIDGWCFKKFTVDPVQKKSTWVRIDGRDGALAGPNGRYMPRPDQQNEIVGSSLIAEAILNGVPKAIQSVVERCN
jgi:RHS repeat-associated protein